MNKYLGTFVLSTTGVHETNVVDSGPAGGKYVLWGQQNRIHVWKISQHFVLLKHKTLKLLADISDPQHIVSRSRSNHKKSDASSIPILHIDKLYLPPAPQEK